MSKKIIEVRLLSNYIFSAEISDKIHFFVKNNIKPRGRGLNINVVSSSDQDATAIASTINNYIGANKKINIFDLQDMNGKDFIDKNISAFEYLFSVQKVNRQNTLNTIEIEEREYVPQKIMT